MFRGKTPESWCCVDCGVNTAPGHPNRKELEGLYIRSAVIKKLTGKETPVSAATFNDRCEIYTVRDTVWKTAGMEPMGGCLCVGCLEKRLDRRLRPKDFTRHPFNTSRGVRRHRYVRRVQRRADCEALAASAHLGLARARLPRA